jgi:Flp pilus assembly protein TadG
MTKRPSNGAARDSRGQSLVEFAIVFPILMLILGGIIQFGLIFWGQNTLTQVVRETGRWASTQQDCADTSANKQLVVDRANVLAASSSLIGYDSGTPWTLANVTVSWNGTPCPPVDNTTAAFVVIEVRHSVPVFFPLILSSGELSSSAEFRMEPKPK